MKQAVIQRPHELQVVEAAPPEVGSGDLLVRSVTVGICGSDLHAFEGRHPFISLPVVPGHEVAGVVEAVGAGVEGFRPGDRVLLEPNLVCGTCFYCSSGRYNLCERLAVVGCQTAGGLAELFVAPAARFHPVPAGMSMTEAALVEPLSTGTHAARIAGDLRGAAIVVLGGGSIGLLTMLAARADGAAVVLVTDPVQGKRRRALDLGAEEAPRRTPWQRSAAPCRTDLTWSSTASLLSSRWTRRSRWRRKGAPSWSWVCRGSLCRSLCRSSRIARFAFKAPPCTYETMCVERPSSSARAWSRLTGS